MKTNKMLSLAMLIAAVLAQPTPAISAAIYDLAADWSDSVNPNGVWSYNEGSNALPSVADWTPLGASFTQPAWAPSANSGNFLPSWFKAAGTVTGLDFAAGDVVVHSTDGFNGSASGTANVTWTSPINGLVDISGAAWMARDIGRANDWTLLLNGMPLTDGSLSSGDSYDSGNPFLFSAGSAGAAALDNVAVSVGDVLSLEISRTTDAGDFVVVDWTISEVSTAVPEPGTLALFGLGLAGLGFARRRKARAAA